MRKTNILFWAGIILLAVFALASANHRIVASSWCGNACPDNEGHMVNSFWDDLKLNDSICRKELNVNTMVNLFYAPDSGYTPYRNQQNWQLIDPKYYISFVDDTASLAKLHSLTSYWAHALDSTDILYFMVTGHGLWGTDTGDPGYHHSYVGDFYDGELTDSIMAVDFDSIRAYKLFVFNSCDVFGVDTGMVRDSSGFATWLCYRNPDSARTIILSAAGPYSANSPGLCDDCAFPRSPQITGLENDTFDDMGTYDYHLEFSFHFLTGLSGGTEPSNYYENLYHVPHFFRDSIDVNRDGQISVREAFVFDSLHNSQPGWENHQMLDLGHLADSMTIWPRIGWLDSFDATPLTFLPAGVDSGHDTTPQVLARNNGTKSACVSVHLWISDTLGDTIYYHSDTSGTIGPHQTNTLSFATWSVNAPVGPLVVRCSTELAGDQNPANDVMVDTIQVFPYTGVADHRPSPLVIKPIPTVMTVQAFGRLLASQREPIAVYDLLGQKVRPANWRTGIYFWRAKTGPTHKLILTD